MKTANILTVPDLISIGVFTTLYFVLVTIATLAVPPSGGLLSQLHFQHAGDLENIRKDGTLLDRCNIVRVLHRLPRWSELPV